MSIYRLKGTSGDLLNKSFPLGSGLRIGGGAEGDIPLNGQAPLAEVLVADGRVVIRSLDPAAELSVNGESCQETALAGGDEIRIAGHRFILQAPGLRPERVLTEAAVRPGRAWWPWLLALAAAGGVAAWQLGWLDQALRALGLAG